ncbi:MAG TPA: hypothetical protein V6D25_09930 [Leptolyngbyaceae cyanobacterium]
MNPQSSPNYIETVLAPYKKPLIDAFEEEAKKYKQQITDEDYHRFNSRFKQLTPQQKKGWVHFLSSEFDIETIENIYKADFFFKIFTEIKEICDNYDKINPEKSYLDGNLFYEVKKVFSNRITDAKKLAGISIGELSSSLKLPKSDAESLQQEIIWHNILNLHLYSKAQKIIEEVRREVIKNKQD